MKAPTLAPVIGTIKPATTSAKVFPMMPHFPERFFSTTRGMSVTARGIFQQLLDVQWMQFGLPSDPADLKHLLGATSAEWKSWPKVAPHFPITSGDGRRRNVKLEEDRAVTIEKAHAHRRGAIETNERRRLKKEADARRVRELEAQVRRLEGGNGD